MSFLVVQTVNDFPADDSGQQIHQVVPSDDPHDQLLDALLKLQQGPLYIPVGEGLTETLARHG